MSTAQATLTITYTGDPVGVDHTRITEDMFVPNLGFDDSQRADDLPGAYTVSLFREAEGEGALVVPAGLTVDCFARDTCESHSFMLLAWPAGEDRAGVTQGWFDVAQIARAAGDQRNDDDPAVVREALEVMAAKFNAALRGE
jgi:hypothetical protein